MPFCRLNARDLRFDSCLLIGASEVGNEPQLLRLETFRHPAAVPAGQDTGLEREPDRLWLYPGRLGSVQPQANVTLLSLERPRPDLPHRRREPPTKKPAKASVSTAAVRNRRAIRHQPPQLATISTAWDRQSGRTREAAGRIKPPVFTRASHATFVGSSRAEQGPVESGLWHAKFVRPPMIDTLFEPPLPESLAMPKS